MMTVASPSQRSGHCEKMVRDSVTTFFGHSRIKPSAGSAVVLAALLWGACSGDSSGAPSIDAPSTGGSGAGGASSTGGAKGTGGIVASGGTSAGGAVASGGSGAGGKIGTGGTTGMGGATGKGGSASTGGALDAGVARTGGAVGTGGSTSTAGMTGAGGTVAGGASGTGKGGAPGSGGATAGRDAGPDLAKGDASPNRGTDATYPAITGKPTVYLAGDSTVQTYSASQAPQQGWGQRIAEFFSKDVAFVNKAVGGRSSKSFIDDGRLTEILGLLKAGDYLFAQWGINDRYKSDPDRYTDPATTFRTYLKQYIDGARSKGAFPVLVTPTPRLDYSNGAFQNGFPDYCTAIKAVGLETNTPVIDLQTMGLDLYTRIGYDAVVKTIALDGPDVLHFRDTGAYQMARLVATGVRDIEIPISSFVLADKLASH